MQQPDLFVAEKASHDERVAEIVKLADRILGDKPEMELSHLAAEICRATVGVGRYALPQRQPQGIRAALGKAAR